MPATVFVINSDNDERKWIAATLASGAHEIVFLADLPELFARASVPPPACLLTSAEPDPAATLDLVRELRAGSSTLPVIVLGAHSAFRTAVDIARLPATDFLERPVSSRQLRLAIRKALQLPSVNGH